ncbi:MAG: hypothetical protein AB1426_11295 [Bacillota bacterium]
MKKGLRLSLRKKGVIGGERMVCREYGDRGSFFGPLSSSEGKPEILYKGGM